MHVERKELVDTKRRKVTDNMGASLLTRISNMLMVLNMLLFRFVC